MSKSWFAVLNNPADHGYGGNPQEVCEKLRDEWIAGSKTRSGAWVYCISASGLHHIHMVLEDTVTMRFSKVKASYAVGMHFEATKGNKTQAEAYITKQPPFDEKGEQVVHTIRHGEIRAAQGTRNDLGEIAAMLDAGMTPEQIMEVKFAYRRYERMIRSAFFAKRKKSVPPHRDVRVHYLVGEAGSGKSYTYVKLCEEYGEEEVYLMSDYDGGGFDSYQAQSHLVLDEMKGQLPFSRLLILLDRYKAQVHARYSNAWALWSDIYITSIFPPEELYKKMVEDTWQGRDKQQQLMRRITDITYCFVDAAGQYQRYSIPMSEYTCYEELKIHALEHVGAPAPPTQIEELPDDTALPF